MNFSGWSTNKRYKKLEDGAKVKKFVNIHAYMEKRCLYLYDSKSGKEWKKCISAKKLSDGYNEVRDVALAIAKDVASLASSAADASVDFSASVFAGGIAIILFLGVVLVGA